jgi:hypothetical protein
METAETPPERDLDAVTASLRPAWSRLREWERIVEAELGDDLCAALPFLWAQWHVGLAGPEGPSMGAKQPQSPAMPLGLDPFEALLNRILADDMLMVTFAFGASWGEARSQAFCASDAA